MKKEHADHDKKAHYVHHDKSHDYDHHKGIVFPIFSKFPIIHFDKKGRKLMGNDKHGECFGWKWAAGVVQALEVSLLRQQALPGASCCAVFGARPLGATQRSVTVAAGSPVLNPSYMNILAPQTES